MPPLLRRYLSRAHSLQSGLPPVPDRTFSRSMLLPVVQDVLLWYTLCFTECQGKVFITPPD
jgi:hypothetical protein